MGNAIITFRGEERSVELIREDGERFAVDRPVPALGITYCIDDGIDSTIYETTDGFGTYYHVKRNQLGGVLRDVADEHMEACAPLFAKGVDILWDQEA